MYFLPSRRERALARAACGKAAGGSVLCMFEEITILLFICSLLSLLEYNLREGRTSLPFFISRGPQEPLKRHSYFWPKLEAIERLGTGSLSGTKESDRLLEGQAALDSHWLPCRGRQAHHR